ncbi:MAG: hypothetical protein E6Q97_38585 [Desulfurellales bacterium]|nr:MAG: hypothetical protein E6Q97_38585 [Desulfurellales bacterium]
MHDQDQDIDQLMQAVVGGEVVQFPPSKSRAKHTDAKPEQAKAAAIAALTAELSLELEQNAAPVVVDPRTLAVRFSNLKHIAKSPLHYYDAVQTDRDDTLAMRLGRGAHAMVLGEPVIQYPGRRAGAAWEAFKAEHADKEILNAKEWHIASSVNAAIRRHPDAQRLLLGSEVVREQQITWEWLGRRCTSRPDARAFNASFLCDLKTTQCADPEKFWRDAMWRGYHAQLAFYALAVRHATGVEPSDLFVMAVESKRPYAVTVLRLDDSARIAGEKMCRLWMERLLACEASNAWPAYTDAVVTVSALDNDGDPDNAIDIDDTDPVWA